MRKQDLGIDINFLNDDLSFTFELFKERRTNIFVDRNNVPLLAGFAQSISANMGIVENKGYEIQFQYNHQFGKDWFVSLHGNMTWNKDKIIENAQATPAYPWLDQRGHNVLSSLGYIAEGLYTSEEQIKERNITQFGETYPGELVKPGDIMYKDLNGDGHIDSYDQCYISRGDVPAYYYGSAVTSVGRTSVWASSSREWQTPSVSFRAAESVLSPIPLAEERFSPTSQTVGASPTRPTPTCSIRVWHGAAATLPTSTTSRPVHGGCVM